MPLWLIVTLVGVAVAVGGLAGLGAVLLWIGLIIVVIGLAQAITVQLRNRR